MKKQVTEIIQSDEIKDLTSDLIESVIDSQITDETLSEIPIVKSIIAAKNIYTSYSDCIFLKKAMNVLLELSDVGTDERKKFIADLDSKYETGAEKILMTIDKLDSHRKCRVFGRLCKLKANEVIDVDEFLRISKVIKDSYLDDLYLINYLDKDGILKLVGEELPPLLSLDLIWQESLGASPILSNGFRRNSLDPEFVTGEIKFNIELTGTGRTLLKIYYELFPEDKKIKN